MPVVLLRMELVSVSEHGCLALAFLFAHRYHDLMYTTTSQTHEPTGSEAEAMEIAHNLRALSHHPAIIVWNACNECDGSGL